MTIIKKDISIKNGEIGATSYRQVLVSEDMVIRPVSVKTFGAALGKQYTAQVNVSDGDLLFIVKWETPVATPTIRKSKVKAKPLEVRASYLIKGWVERLNKFVSVPINDHSALWSMLEKTHPWTKEFLTPQTGEPVASYIPPESYGGQTLHDIHKESSYRSFLYKHGISKRELQKDIWLNSTKKNLRLKPVSINELTGTTLAEGNKTYALSEEADGALTDYRWFCSYHGNKGMKLLIVTTDDQMPYLCFPVNTRNIIRVKEISSSVPGNDDFRRYDIDVYEIGIDVLPYEPKVTFEEPRVMLESDGVVTASVYDGAFGVHNHGMAPVNILTDNFVLGEVVSESSTIMDVGIGIEPSTVKLDDGVNTINNEISMLLHSISDDCEMQLPA